MLQDAARVNEQPIEIDVDFRSRQEWADWAAANGAKFAGIRDAILAAARRDGVTLPISEQHLPGESITIDPANLRESISANETNSRKRAGMLMLQRAIRRMLPQSPRAAKIIGAEGVTQVALMLRRQYPYFLGCEYLPTPAERERYYPIPHLDLGGSDFPGGRFDAFYSSDVLEHVPDLRVAIAEIARLLRPGGVLVSMFPMRLYEDETEVRARIGADGSIEHILPPEYHGNPVRPTDGSLVFAIPGWDVLETCRAVGFADAKLTMIASARHGITATHEPGVFALVATKAEAGATVAVPAAAPAPIPPAPTPQATRFAKVIGLVAQPRSGTTVITSMLSVHPRICGIFEPFNANKAGLDLDRSWSLDELIEDLKIDTKEHDILLIKETATDLRYIDRVAEIVRTSAAQGVADMILMVRNPFHIFLSEVQARREWWGEAELETTGDLFDAWADRTIAGLKRLRALATEFDPIILSYDKIARDPALIQALMDALDVPLDPRQPEYEKHVDRSAVRGDIGLASKPQPLSAASTERRAEEAGRIEALLAGTRRAPIMREIEAAIALLGDRPLGRAGGAAELWAVVERA